ncbi:hypothetical protein FJQ87_12000 [Shewanella sp. SNU WT4]|uniref:PliI family lysozyme inhibitor of I-type lysozyme n=1 Tax=Shewanella sp. SNU WT4 TaxID=2590015 RepID=UPI00112C1164|nr:PliI family lysozyme inhibitor of I-type lysozyme [Shewanella sp. SNU WT4]QDF67321.1 hypothetical protein FJQ87_12000 [Shewanella sp. SNU WT4]
MLSLCKIEPDRKVSPISSSIRGVFFGLIAVLSGAPLAATDVSVTPCESNTEAAYFSQSMPLNNGMSVVVSEGQYEPRSIGTMTVILYQDLNVGDLASGLVISRDGFITKTALNAAQSQLTITTSTAGSGNYSQAYQVCIDGKQLKLC